MGGFTSQVQPTQVSGPASKGAGLSANQLGMNPIQVSPQEQLLKTQQLQAEQPSFPQGNQMPQEMGPPLGGMMGGRVTMPGQGGQPKLGMPNAYSNTIQPWDNQSNQQGQPSGKGMGASGASGKGV